MGDNIFTRLWPIRFGLCMFTIYVHYNHIVGEANHIVNHIVHTCGMVSHKNWAKIRTLCYAASHKQSLGIGGVLVMILPAFPTCSSGACLGPWKCELACSFLKWCLSFDHSTGEQITIVSCHVSVCNNIKLARIILLGDLFNMFLEEIPNLLWFSLFGFLNYPSVASCFRSFAISG